MKYVNIHGYNFSIDTSDWIHSADADTVSDDIETQMRLWTPKQASEYHLLLSKASEGEADFDDPRLQPVNQMCAECAGKVLDTYLNTSVLTGHNYSINAEHSPFERARLLAVLYDNFTDEMWHCTDKGTVEGKVTIQFNVDD